MLGSCEFRVQGLGFSGFKGRVGLGFRAQGPQL